MAPQAKAKAKAKKKTGPKRKTGPKGPTKMTPTTIQKLEQAFSFGCPDTEACLFAGIATSTLYAYQEKHPEFVERKAQLKETPILKARQTVINALDDADMAFKFLERKRRAEFAPKQIMEHVGDDDKPIVVYHLPKKPAE